MKKIRTLIVDDELLARDRMRQLLQNEAEVEIIGECSDGRMAVATIQQQSPDLVFLDVQMPKRDGFEVLSELKREERPVVIFVTAYDQYAIRAFEFCAMDYLLKPFRDARFLAALARAKAEVRKARTIDVGQKVELLLNHVRALGLPTPVVSPGPAAEAPVAEAPVAEAPTAEAPASTSTEEV